MKKKFEKTYQEAMNRLQEIINSLEKDEIDLDKMESILQESKELVTLCSHRLRQIQTHLEEFENSKT